jgi:glutamate dehydrogenase
LKQLGFDTENDSFTVKITGGPNGDVAGNMIKILWRDYSERAKIVGMCDHSGGAENEDGLDMNELLRLFKADLPISEYDISKIGAGGRLYGIATPDEIQLRNTMHNRLKADAFIPAGGRPNTININNYEKFFFDDGTPSAPLIVEAANIFTSPEARAEIAKRGVTIVKDSSANNAGVCCSSYEIVSSMLLSKEEFMAVKDELVEDVLNKLRESARVEAELLFREYRANPRFPIVHYSEAISGAINRASDAVIGALKKHYDMINDETRQRLLMESLPDKLVEVAGERLEDLPKMYIISMIGAKLGSKIVYNEGLQFIESMTDGALVSLAAKYVQYDDSLKKLFAAVEHSDIDNKEHLLKVLKAAGVKSVISSGI